LWGLPQSVRGGPGQPVSNVMAQAQGIPIDEVAHAAGTVGYELMCALAARVPVQIQE